MIDINIITSEKNWIEDIAIRQLKEAAALPGVVQAVGLPDLHAGKTPIGAVIVTQGVIYPQMIGGDIGCGMALYSTGLEHKKFKRERWVTKLNHIRELADLPTANPYAEPSPIYDLGTMGGGNHFAEFQVLDTIYNQALWQAAAFDETMLMLLIHSGSRGYGQRIINRYNEADGLPIDSEAMQAYMREHDQAVLWAARNRRLVADKLLQYLGYQQPITAWVDCRHNFIEAKGDTYIHRKGAVSAEQGLVVIPGSRGSLTYLVKPAADTAIAAYSLSHGTGRKWARSLCKSRICNKYDRDTIRQTHLKSQVVCHDTDLLFQEAPEAYKNIKTVIDCLVRLELIEVVATLRPLLTYKG